MLPRVSPSLEISLVFLSFCEEPSDDTHRTPTRHPQKHPLLVELVLVPEQVSLHFTYLTNLRVVCAGSSHADTTLLVNLFPADSGLTSPNSANTLLAAELSFDRAPARPYAWAQQVRPSRP